MTARPQILTPDRIIDGDGKGLPQGTALRIQDGHIAAVGAAGDLRGGEAEEVELTGLTMLPGFIDLHGYLSVDPDRPEPMRRMFDPDLAGRRRTALAHMLTDLRSGVTTQRVMGEGNGLDLELSRSVRDGDIDGPTLVVCGAPIAPTGSHQAPASGGIDTSDALRQAVRLRAAAGVEFLKLVLTGGINGAGNDALAPLYGADDLDLLFAEAAAAALPVAVAAHGGPAVAMAAVRGAVSIEHCALFDAADLAALSASATTPVLTLSRFFAPGGIARSASDNPVVLERLDRAKKRLSWLCGAIAEGGQAFGLGTDNMHGQIADDARLAVELGLPRPRVIAALTGTAARLIGRDTRIGWIRAGFAADLVAVAGNPLDAIESLGAVRGVWRGGRHLSRLTN